MKVILTIFSLIMGLVSSDAHANLSCNSIFANQALRTTDRLMPEAVKLSALRFEVDNRTNEITSTSDPRFKATVLDMLGMMSETVFITGDFKAINEKGELRLAVEYKNGQSVEFEYFGDKRGRETVYRLGKISFIKANGKDITLEKNPLTDDGTRLQKSEFIVASKESKSSQSAEIFNKVSVIEKSDVESWSEGSADVKKVVSTIKKDQDLVTALRDISKNLSEADAQIIETLSAEQQVIKVPTAISGPVLQQMIKWSELLPVLKRTEVHQAIEKGSTKGLLLKAQFKSNAEYAFKVAKKQTFKYILVGSVIFAFTRYSSVVSQENSEESSTTILSDLLIAKSTFSKENAQVFSKIASAFSKEADPLFDQLIASRTVRKVTALEIKESTERVQHSIAGLVAKEETQKGKARFYIGDVKMRLTPLENKTMSRALSSADYMIGHFEKQNKVAIVSIFRSKLTSRIEMAEVIIDRQAHPKLYANIRENLKSIMSLPAK